MKLLFDQNLSFKLSRQLGDLFPGSRLVGDFGLATASDRTVWNHARAGDYTLVTHDADFAEMVALLGPPPKIAWLRFGNSPTSFVAERLREKAEVIKMFGLDANLSCLEIY